jgi:hypothetical protein
MGKTRAALLVVIAVLGVILAAGCGKSTNSSVPPTPYSQVPETATSSTTAAAALSPSPLSVPSYSPTTAAKTATTPALLSIETVVDNLSKNSGNMPPGATSENDWWYWDLTLKNPNSFGVTILSGKKHLVFQNTDNTSDLATSMTDAFGTNYLPANGEITWHAAYMYFRKAAAPFQAVRTVTFLGKDDFGRDVTVEYTLTVTVD